ncbi:hypothetical protein [Mogibacterium timidum]|uniref:hypothetical protein n=1 Tax=Mogibacterium timidum TaxID=35519 RepID=UPI002356D897|nr:hypothetical protein [Mogibacterium timidum]
MTAVLLSANAHPELRSYLANSGYTIRTFPEINTVSHLTTNRPYVLICKLFNSYPLEDLEDIGSIIEITE